MGLWVSCAHAHEAHSTACNASLVLHDNAYSVDQPLRCHDPCCHRRCATSSLQAISLLSTFSDSTSPVCAISSTSTIIANSRLERGRPAAAMGGADGESRQLLSARGTGEGGAVLGRDVRDAPALGDDGGECGMKVRSLDVNST